MIRTVASYFRPLSYSYDQILQQPAHPTKHTKTNRTLAQPSEFIVRNLAFPAHTQVDHTSQKPYRSGQLCSLGPLTITPRAYPPTNTPASVALFKRTHASADARADAQFLATYFGLNITLNQTFQADAPDGDDGSFGRRCAVRVALQDISAFELHFFESSVTPEGPTPVADWVAYWREVHGGFAGRSRDRSADSCLPCGNDSERW